VNEKADTEGSAKSATWREALRHPLLVGAVLALISGLLASLLIPALTRVWQDRPRELALKRSLVTRMSRESTLAIESIWEGGYEPTVNKTRETRGRFLLATERRWRLQSAVIASELGTYFPDSDVQRRWRQYAELIGLLAEDVAFNGFAITGLGGPTRYFASVRLGDPELEQVRRQFVASPDDLDLNLLRVLLLAERERLASQVARGHAAGFSHGFWIFH
jgi:hypothetical protein